MIIRLNFSISSFEKYITRPVVSTYTKDSAFPLCLFEEKSNKKDI